MTHKPKETPEDCADAWWVSDDNHRVAVSDGVTRSLYPGIFAEGLVYRFCVKSDEVLPDSEAWLAPVRARWLEDAEKRVAKLKLKRDPAFINNRERLQTRTPGAATFAGVKFMPEQGEGGTAKITVIGDSCLFIFVDGRFWEAFPCASSAEFDNQPKAFLSYAEQKNLAVAQSLERPMLPPTAKSAHFILATDALAKWIFERHEKGENVLPVLLALKTEDGFSNFVATERERDSQALNDDVTLVIIQIEEPQTTDDGTKRLRVNPADADKKKITRTALPTHVDVRESSASEGQTNTKTDIYCATTRPTNHTNIAAFKATIIALIFAFLFFSQGVMYLFDDAGHSDLHLCVVVGCGILCCVLLVCQAVFFLTNGKNRTAKRTKAG